MAFKILRFSFLIIDDFWRKGEKKVAESKLFNTKYK
jgi:hypothetical protein